MSPSAMSDESLQGFIDDMIKSKVPAPVPRVGGRARTHPGRTAAKTKRYVCTKVDYCPSCAFSLAMTNPGCHSACIFYPPGVDMVGCGRIYSTRHGLEVVHPKNYDDPVRYPYGCLSDILAADEREVK